MADHIDRLSYTMVDHIDRLRVIHYVITLTDCHTLWLITSDRLSYTMADHIDRLSYTMADHIDSHYYGCSLTHISR